MNWKAAFEIGVGYNFVILGFYMSRIQCYLSDDSIEDVK